jgi:hypothetical protein
MALYNYTRWGGSKNNSCHLLTRGAQVMSRFRGQGTSERSKHVGTIIVLLAQPLPSRVTDLAAGTPLKSASALFFWTVYTGNPAKNKVVMQRWC